MKFQGCNYFTTACLSRLLNKKAEEAFKELKLAPSYAYILACVHDEPGIDCKRMGELMMLTPSSLTRMMDKLEDMGYLDKKVSGRNMLHILTPEGEKLMPKIKEGWQRLGCEFERVFGDEFSRELAQVVTKAIEACHKAD